MIVRGRAWRRAKKEQIKKGLQKEIDAAMHQQEQRAFCRARHHAYLRPLAWFQKYYFRNDGRWHESHYSCGSRSCEWCIGNKTYQLQRSNAEAAQDYDNWQHNRL